MGASFGGDDELISNINITPFVDIILVVLIIFMVTATTIAQQAILVKLPEAASSEDVSTTTSLGLTLLSDGELLLDGEPITPDALRERIREAFAADEEVVCLIAADELVAHGRVVWLMDLVKTEGVTSFAINIDPSASLPPDPASLGKGRGSAPATP